VFAALADFFKTNVSITNRDTKILVDRRDALSALLIWEGNKVPGANLLLVPGTLSTLERGGQLFDGRTQLSDFSPQIRILGFQFSDSRVHADAKVAKTALLRPDQIAPGR
jgi:hypothetical protein